MILRRLRLGLLFLAPVSWLGLATAETKPVLKGPESVEAATQRLWKPAGRDSRLAEVLHSANRPNCERTRPPEALTTPDPLVEGTDEGIRITVTFIIGIDGKVRSPLILESSGKSEDGNVLEVVRSWRYRPAMCNGVPTEAEAKIEFSSR